MQFESWIDRQIREAAERGEFDNLPGASRPLSLDDDPDWWVKAKIAREGLEPLLPTALSLRKEVEQLGAVLRQTSSETEARALIDDLNTRIREYYRRPGDGPKVPIGLIDEEATLERWRAWRNRSIAG